MQKQSVEGFRLSPQQEHLWLLQQSEAGLPSRAMCALELTGKLDLATLESAVGKAINRHEILRTTFQRLQGMTAPLQVVSDNFSARIHQHDLSDLQLPPQSNAIMEMLTEAYLPTDLDDTTPLYLSLLTKSPDEHILLISLHALCADMIGLKNFVSELGRCYAASVNGEEILDEPMQYPDFSEWQHEILNSEETETGRAHWRQDLEEEQVEIVLPLEDTSVVAQKFSPQILSRTLDANTVARLEQELSEQDSSLSTALLASFFLLLSRLTDASRLSLGVSFDGRNYEELASALGLFARFLPIKAELDANLTISELLTTLDSSLSEAHRWQELFINHSQSSAAPTHFPFCFEFIDEAGTSLNVTDFLSFTLVRSSAYVSRFKVLLRCLRQSDGSARVEWHYDAAVYEEAEMSRLAERWATVVESISRQSGAVRLAEVEIVGASEREDMLRLSRGEAQPWQGVQCLHEIFAAQAMRTPDARAVSYEQESLTYRALNERANQLAHYLQGKGVKAESRVGLMLERSLEMVVGMLGIMKAGGGYVPLEQSQPVERLKQMVADAGVQVIVSMDEWRAEVEAVGAAEAVYLDGERAEIEQERVEELAAVAGEQNVAYVIYTSGSTGSPKGVMISHRAICNRLLWMLKKFPMTADDSVLQKTPYNFDASIWEFFVPLFAGARLVMARPEGHQDSAYLVSEIIESNITTLQLVPSMLRIVLEEQDFDKCKSLRRVFCGGEALTANIQEQFFARMNMELYNLYGPTETAIDATSWTFKADDESRAVIIGRPLANTQVYLLDSNLNPVPCGVGGELHIGGVNLARGYLNRPELTAERFIPNPFSDQPGERLYKTGDLARYLENGAIEYLGRIDHQVKLRGFRIELGEIEAVLGRHPQVRQAVVMVREDEAEHKRLVAYIVAPDENELTVSELYSYLKTLLPEYMIPSAFVIMTELPLLSNGKINRKLLPVPEQVRPELEQDYVAPRTPTEELLASIWQQVLGLEHVGIHDNFFELGGDSILSIQIVARANQAGLKLSPKQLFRHQSIAELSEAIALSATTDAQPIAAEQGLLTGPLPLTPIQHYFFEQRLEEQHHFNQSLLLTVRRAISTEQLQQVVTALVEHHDGLRLRFIETTEGWQQSYVAAQAINEVVVQQIDVSHLQGEEQSAAIEAASAAVQRSLNLTSGGLLKVVLFETGAEQRLLVVAHHLIVDGVSWRILIEDMARGLEQAERGEAIEFGRKTTSYGRWAERLAEYAQSEEAVSERAYWSEIEKREAKRLPVDYPGGENTIGLSSSVVRWLDAETTRALLQEVPKAYRTQINDVLLTAVVEAIGKWSGQRQALIEMEGHGRADELFDDIDLSRTVGWFTSVYPVSLNLEGITDVGASLKHVKEHLRAIPRGGIGYGILKYLCAADAAVEKSQQAIQTEVSFNYLGQMDQAIDEDSLFAGAPESAGAMQSERGERRYLLEITMAVSGGRLQVQWSYGVRLHAKETIERLAEDYVEALRQLVAHCQSGETEGFTASDFSLVEFDEAELDQILNEVEFEGV